MASRQRQGNELHQQRAKQNSTLKTMFTISNGPDKLEQTQTRNTMSALPDKESVSYVPLRGGLLVNNMLTNCQLCSQRTRLQTQHSLLIRSHAQVFPIHLQPHRQYRHVNSKHSHKNVQLEDSKGSSQSVTVSCCEHSAPCRDLLL